MTDKNNNKLTLLTVLVSILLIAVIAQSVAMMGMRKELQRTFHTSRPTPTTVATDDDKRDETIFPLPKASFDNELLDLNLDEWDPFKEMHAMHDRINQMFGNAYNRFRGSDHFGSFFDTHPFSPSVNIENKNDRYLITVDLPGAEESRLDINLEGRTLTISGNVESETLDDQKGTILRQERHSGQFRRTITLPGPVQADKMTTKSKKGILYIEIPKTDETI